jgi:hypothetical protein
MQFTWDDSSKISLNSQKWVFFLTEFRILQVMSNIYKWIIFKHYTIIPKKNTTRGNMFVINQMYQR